MIHKSQFQNINYTNRIREATYGKIDGSPLKVLLEAREKSPLPYREFKGPKGESWEDVKWRAKSWLEDEIIYKKEKHLKFEQDILVVTHGGFICELFNAIETIQDPSFEPTNYIVNNTSLSIVQLTKQLDQ